MDFYKIIDASRLQTFAFWVVVAYSVVLLSMVIDLVAAYVRCKRLGEKWVSDKQKRTSEKAEKYFLPMLALSFVDVLTFVLVQYPVFTMVMAVINALTEWRSVFEKSHTKQEQREAAQTMSVIIKNKDELAKVLVELLKEGKVK